MSKKNKLLSPNGASSLFFAIFVSLYFPIIARGENWSGFWSRRIDERNRFIYRIRDDQIEIAQCMTQ